MARNIVIGSRTQPEKIIRARELRRNMTPGEKILWERLRTNQFHGFHFRRQQIIDGFIADFYCHSAGLVIEIDGPIHASQKEYDSELDQVFLNRGLRVLRITEDEVILNINEALEKISLFLKTHKP